MACVYDSVLREERRPIKDRQGLWVELAANLALRSIFDVVRMRS